MTTRTWSRFNAWYATHVVLLMSAVLWLWLTAAGWIKFAETITSAAAVLPAPTLALDAQTEWAFVTILLAIFTLPVVRRNADIPSAELAWRQTDARQRSKFAGRAPADRRHSIPIIFSVTASSLYPPVSGKRSASSLYLLLCLLSAEARRVGSVDQHGRGVQAGSHEYSWWSWFCEPVSTCIRLDSAVCRSMDDRRCPDLPRARIHLATRHRACRLRSAALCRQPAPAIP